ncbi:Uroporphyrinogen decarboxylase [Hibiscus syriacus]|uniref:Uroporphyrinogen decarboxylase n=1 Tax=Hibiscus syriacus TaxID=106335 RepID=A0A6A2YTA2_HIBSY|nr:Uroporphyrinogen decarboxylase [Hibiscus syriacus]
MVRPLHYDRKMACLQMRRTVALKGIGTLLFSLYSSWGKSKENTGNYDLLCSLSMSVVHISLNKIINTDILFYSYPSTILFGTVVEPKATTASEPLLLNAVRGQDVERPPVWLMRQAGRSENVDIVVEISLQPWNVFQPDGVILFSDILTPLSGMNIPFDIVKGKGPIIFDPIATAADVDQVTEFSPEESVPYVGEALTILQKESSAAARRRCQPSAATLRPPFDADFFLRRSPVICDIKSGLRFAFETFNQRRSSRSPLPFFAAFRRLCTPSFLHQNQRRLASRTLLPCVENHFSMEPQPPSQPRRTRDASGAAGETSGSNSSYGFSYYGKEKCGREIEKERTKLRKRNRRAFTRRLLAGLRQYGDFSLPVRSDMNAVLAALAREVGWTVESDGTTYRHCPSHHNQQNLREIYARSGERPLSTNSLEKCAVKGTLDCQPPVVRIDDSGMSSSQGENYRMEKLSLVEATPVLSAAEVDHHEIKKGYSNEKSSEVARRRRNGFQNRQKEGHINGRNGYSNGCVSLFIENLPEKMHWKRLGYIFEARRAISNMNGSRIDGSKIGVFSLNSNLDIPIGGSPRQVFFVLNNCLVGWCKDFVKIGHLARQMQAKGLTGFTLMRATGNAILMIFEDNASLRSVENDKSKIFAEWFSIVEAWSESLVMECRRVWLVCEGVPFHAWNWDTFKNIAEKWGLLLAIDESCHSPSTFDRAKIQVLTKADSRIDALVELKVGDNFFKVMVHEIELSFKPNSWAPEEDESH